MAKQSSVLHVFCGVMGRGGAFEVARRIAVSHELGLYHAIWMHKDFNERDGLGVDFIRRGLCSAPNSSALLGVIDAVAESVALCRFLRKNHYDILHAHTRVGILASVIAGSICRIPVVIHLHSLAKNAFLYRWLGLSKNVVLLPNSRKTRDHYGLPPDAPVCFPYLDWPESCVPPCDEKRPDGVRFVTASEIVEVKNIDKMLDGWSEWIRLGRGGQFAIYGFSQDPLSKRYSEEMYDRASSLQGAEPLGWSDEWPRELTGCDIYIHLSTSDSFGLSLLCAFARGVRLVVCRGTFLDDLTDDLSSLGITQVDRLSAESVAQAMLRASELDADLSGIWERRRVAAVNLLPENNIAVLKAIYTGILPQAGV